MSDAADTSPAQDAMSQPSEAGDLLAQLAAAEGAHEERARRALRTLAPAEALPALASALRDDANAGRRRAAREIFADWGRPGEAGADQVIGLLAELAASEDADVRILALSAFGDTGNSAARPAAEAALADSDPNVISAAADALGGIGDPRAAASLCSALQGGTLWSRAAAVVALGALRNPSAVPHLAAVSDPELAGPVADALARIADPAGLDALRRSVNTEDAAVRSAAETAAASILSAHPDHPVPHWLREALAGREQKLAANLQDNGDDCAARLLGLAATDAAAGYLLDALRRDELRPLAAAGLALIPAAVVVPPILSRLPGSRGSERVALLNALPPAPPAPADAVRSLVRELASPETRTRAAAAEALARSDASLVLPHLLRAVEEPASRAGAAEALGRIPGAPLADRTRLLSDADANVRTAAAAGLARFGASDALDVVLAALERENDPAARRALIRALGAAGGGAAVSRLAASLEAGDAGQRFAAVSALGQTGSGEALAPLMAALDDEDAGVQAAALRALGALGDPRATGPVTDCLEHGNRDLRRAAAAALDHLAPAAAGERLFAALDDDDWEVRLAAVRALRQIASPRAVAALAGAAASDPDPLVRNAAAQAASSAHGGTDEEL